MEPTAGVDVGVKGVGDGRVVGENEAVGDGDGVGHLTTAGLLN